MVEGGLQRSGCLSRTVVVLAVGVNRGGEMTLVKLRQQRWQNIELGSGASHDCFDVPMYLFCCYLYAIYGHMEGGYST